MEKLRLNSCHNLFNTQGRWSVWAQVFLNTTHRAQKCTVRFSFVWQNDVDDQLAATKACSLLSWHSNMLCTETQRSFLPFPVDALTVAPPLRFNPGPCKFTVSVRTASDVHTLGARATENTAAAPVTGGGRCKDREVLIPANSIHNAWNWDLRAESLGYSGQDKIW